MKIAISDVSINFLSNMANGDVRSALNALELAVKSVKPDKTFLKKELQNTETQMRKVLQDLINKNQLVENLNEEIEYFIWT